MADQPPFEALRQAGLRVADVTLLPLPTASDDRARFDLRMRLASLEGERRTVAAQRSLYEIDRDIAAVRHQLEDR